MKPILRHVLRLLALATFWGLSGYMIGAAIAAAFYLIYPVGVILGSLNLILGMLLFLGITRDPTAERIFFEGPHPNESGRVEVGCLWALPVSLLLYGLWLWVLVFFVRFIAPS